MGGGNQFAKDPSTFQVSGVKLSAAEIQVLREELEPLLSISDIQMKTAYSSNDSQTRDDIEMNPPLLPASAKPNHWKHLSYAHMAAKLLREDKSVLAEEAFRKVAPPDATRKDDSIRRAIRDAFDLIYKSDGTPL